MNQIIKNNIDLSFYDGKDNFRTYNNTTFIHFNCKKNWYQNMKNIFSMAKSKSRKGSEYIFGIPVNKDGTTSIVSKKIDFMLACYKPDQKSYHIISFDVTVNSSKDDII